MTLSTTSNRGSQLDRKLELRVTGGSGILLLLAVTSIAVIGFFALSPRGDDGRSRLIATAISFVVETRLTVLAVRHDAALLDVPPGSPAA